MSEQPKKNIFDDLNKAVLDLTGQVFGEKGKDFLKSAEYQIKEFNISALRAWVGFTDQILEDTKLGENELIKKSNDTVKDLLTQFGVLDEEDEDDF